MGKSTISMAIFNSFLLVYQRVATITSRFVFFLIGTCRSQARSKLLAHFYPQPRRAQSGQMWPEWDPRGTGNLGKNILELSGKSLFQMIFSWDKNLEIWETTWRFLVNFQFHDFFCKTAQDCGMQPGKAFLDVPRWEFFRPPRGAGVCHSFDCSFWDSSRTIKAT